VTWLYDFSDFLESHGAAITALATVAIAVFTWVLARITNKLANLAKEDADIAKDALIVGNSAFVFVQDIKAYFLYDSAGKANSWTFRPFWTNSGGTQTRGMLAHVDYEFRDRPLPTTFKFADNTPATAPSLIGPKSTIVGGQVRFFSVAELLEVQQKTRFLYLWGWVRYNDIFPNTPQHLTRYCTQVDVTGDLTDGQGAQFSYIIHLEGNCSDGDSWRGNASCRASTARVPGPP
jgi:hypothetical protein